MSYKEVSENISLLSYSVEELKQLASQVATGKYTGDLKKLRDEVAKARGKLSIEEQNSALGNALTNLDRAISIRATASKEGERKSDVLHATGKKIVPETSEPPTPPERFMEQEPSVQPGKLGTVLESYVPHDEEGQYIQSGVNGLQEVLGGLAGGVEISDEAALDAANGLLNDKGNSLDAWYSQFTGSDKQWKEFVEALGSGDAKKIKEAFKMYYENTSEDFKNNTIKAGLEGTYIFTGKTLLVFSSGISVRFLCGKNEGESFEYVAFGRQKRELTKELEKAKEELKQKRESGIAGKLLEPFTERVAKLEKEIEDLDKKASWKVFCLLKAADQVLSLETKKLEGGQLITVDPTYLHEITGLVDFEFEAYSLGTGRRIVSYHLGVEAGGVVVDGPVDLEDKAILKAHAGVSWYLGKWSQTTSITFDTTTNILTPGEIGTEYSLYCTYRGELLSVSAGARGFFSFDKLTREAIPHQAFISMRTGEEFPLIGPLAKAIERKAPGLDLDATLLVYHDIPGIVDTRSEGEGGVLAGLILSYKDIISLTAEGGAVTVGPEGTAPYVGVKFNFGPSKK